MMPSGTVTSHQAVIRELGKPGDLGWVVMAHGEIYAREFGWDASFEALVARIVADYASDRDPRPKAAWIAELDGRRAGCVFLVAADSEEDLHQDGVAQLRILLVAPEARGHGIGRRLVGTAVDFARAAGYGKVRLWTNHPLVAARQIYLEYGFVLVGADPHHSFGVDLIGQTYELDLRGYGGATLLDHPEIDSPHVHRSATGCSPPAAARARGGG